ncbi:hypothetical protein ASE66_13155 [Bosea sp. Root483D1]|uniref:DUF2958 domain-containing protein n=1 Tax=Bosea sp. Root483D1 TaxID=1736544 RepID=UPI00070E0E6F|nr:DUF2958 domain-containing protein [Bosea sp. Root483D1]KRE14330.1 hypothetical protein ASE66_13155 [Bosea sp. Root483D1]
METSATFVIPLAEHDLLLANGRLTASGVQNDPLPVVRLFMSDTEAFFLLFNLDPAQPDCSLAFYDLGVGQPRVGHISLAEVAGFRGAGSIAPCGATLRSSQSCCYPHMRSMPPLMHGCSRSLYAGCSCCIKADYGR